MKEWCLVFSDLSLLFMLYPFRLFLAVFSCWSCEVEDESLNI